MKKKISDLTLGEVKEICRNTIHCVTCPLQESLCNEEYILFADFKLDQEIEVNEND